MQTSSNTSAQCTSHLTTVLDWVLVNVSLSETVLHKTSLIMLKGADQHQHFIYYNDHTYGILHAIDKDRYPTLWLFRCCTLTSSVPWLRSVGWAEGEGHRGNNMFHLAKRWREEPVQQSYIITYARTWPCHETCL